MSEIVQPTPPVSGHFLDQPINGYIYLITNLINNKRYIGQTTQALQTRWQGHLSEARCHGLHSKMAVDRAIAKHGEENFSFMAIEHIVNQPRRVLDQRERYWIQHYKTYVPQFGSAYGYNMSIGGSNNATLLSYAEEQELVAYYMQHRELTFVELATHFDVSVSIVHSVLQKNDVPPKTPSEVAKAVQTSHGEEVLCQDMSGNVIATFVSSREAARWVQSTETKIVSDISGIARRIRLAAYSGESVYGFIWDIPQLDDIAKAGRYAKSRERIVRQNDSEHIHQRMYSEGKRCPICDKPIINQAIACVQHRWMFDIRENGEVYMPHHLNGHAITEEQMRELVRFHSWSDIGKMYGVTDNAVKKFAKKHFGIERKQSETCHIWNDEYQCYEYTPRLPLDIDDLHYLQQQGDIINLLCQRYRISSRNVMRKYLILTFGSDWNQ